VTPSPPSVAERAPDRVSSLALPRDSDLVMVETRFAPPPVEEEPAPARARRVRPARAPVIDEPVPMVETRKESTP
jgi:hypothetical protein